MAEGAAWTMQEWLDVYGESHQNPTNKAIHWFAVPAIFASIVGLLWSVPVPELMALSTWANWASVALVMMTINYARLSVPLAVGMTLYALGCLVLGERYAALGPTPLWQACLALFAGGWIFQFIGHKIEGKKPSFFEDIQFLMIGPAWLLSFIYNRLGIRY